ncbi:MAG: hypothetical protein KAJ24_03295 [Candidatus Aenigmarchaeota archaeon]|nr:hypothetical protein [Candidatus Aenigmarchaeota archaeon]
MTKQVELRQTYTPNGWDNALEITRDFVYALKFFNEHPLETVQHVPEGSKHGIYSEPYRLKDAGLIEYLKPTNGISITDRGEYVLEQISQNPELCDNMLIVNTIPFPEKHDVDFVSIVTMDAYKEAIKNK